MTTPHGRLMLTSWAASPSSLSAAVRVFVLQTLTAPTFKWEATRLRAIASIAVVATPRDASKQGGQDRLRTLSAAARSSSHGAPRHTPRLFMLRRNTTNRELRRSTRRVDRRTDRDLVTE